MKWTKKRTVGPANKEVPESTMAEQPPLQNPVIYIWTNLRRQAKGWKSEIVKITTRLLNFTSCLSINKNIAHIELSNKISE